MTIPGLIRRRLLAGSVGPERRPARPDPTEPRWFEPRHVRDPRRAREHLADQVAVGADVVVAPTWRTHRRALLSVGETRQARAWTAAALRIGREAIETGLERRAERDRAREAEPDEAAASPSPLARPTPLLAASLPALDEAPEPGMGRLLPRQAASERDYRDQAGLLADAEPDLLLVEGQGSLAELRIATAAALETGLPVWLAVSSVLEGHDAPARVRDALDGLDLHGVLWPGRATTDPTWSTPSMAEWGGLLGEASDADAWLDAGATLLGWLDGATPGRLEPVRAAIDRVERAGVEAAQRVEDAWWAHVRRAASMAEGGAALWLRGQDDPLPPASRLPDGFAWVVASSDEAGSLPRDHFRLVVEPTTGGPQAVFHGAPWLTHGGIVASRGLPHGSAPALRIISVDETLAPPLVIARREAQAPDR